MSQDNYIAVIVSVILFVPAALIILVRIRRLAQPRLLELLLTVWTGVFANACRMY